MFPESAFEAVIAGTVSETETRLAALTACDRDEWARERLTLLAAGTPENCAAFQRIESACTFIIAFDDVIAWDDLEPQGRFL